ncbi:MAG: sel1 repeat family protein [Hyphomicrobiales bacterium]|nr:sel1 repeat family protein [Hyphomicrobiales bacterium]
MRTSKAIALPFALAVLWAAAPARAFDGAGGPGGGGATAAFSDPAAALARGIADYGAGDRKGAVAALAYAARGGEWLAQWRLARMYAAGDGVARDDLRAYRYYSQIVASYDEDSGDLTESSAVANAFVAVGRYRLSGIPRTPVARDSEAARRAFEFAAINFGDPDAQYDLARMYLDGDGVRKDARQAARWFALAAQKNHAPARALLGHLLYTGQGGVPKDGAKGLMWMTLAARAAHGAADRWMIDLLSKDLGQGAPGDRKLAALDLAAPGPDGSVASSALIALVGGAPETTARAEMPAATPALLPPAAIPVSAGAAPKP